MNDAVTEKVALHDGVLPMSGTAVIVGGKSESAVGISALTTVW